MPKYFFLLALLLSPIFIVEASVVGTCQASLPTVNKAQCREDNYYSTYRAAANTAINATNDAKTDEVGDDNQAAITSEENIIAEKSTINMAGFIQCQRDVCENYYNVCSGSGGDLGSSRRFETNASNCLKQGDQAIAIAQAAAWKTALTNAYDKARITVFEKMMAIIYRTKEFILPNQDDSRKLLGEISTKQTHLTKAAKEVPASTVQ